MWREVVVRKLNIGKELSKATEMSEKSRFFRGAPKTKTTPTVRGSLLPPFSKDSTSLAKTQLHMAGSLEEPLNFFF